MSGVVKSFQALFLSGALTILALPSMAAECKALQRVMSLDLKPLPSGHAGVEVMIGDSPEIFLIDTGGAISTVTKTTVDKLKLPTSRSRRRALTGVNGARSDLEARLPSITIGTLHQANPLLMVMPDITGTNRTLPFAGYLAPDFLGGFDLDFDFAAGKLNLFSPDHCAGQVVYWQAPTVAAVPFTLDKNAAITFPMELDGKKVNAVLDTGAPRSTLNLTLAKRVFDVDTNAPDVEKVGELVGGFSTDIYRRRFKTLSVQAVTVNNPLLFLMPDLVAGTANQNARTGSLFREERALPQLLLGMTTLSQLHLYVAYKERKLYISVPQRPAPAAAPAPRTAAVAFCPSPETKPAAAQTLASPSVGNGMTAFQKRDVALAYANLWPLANGGNAEAERDLGIVLRQSCEMADKSPAASWLKKAADAGDAQGAAVLGDMYLSGDGIESNDAEALRYVTIGANAGILPAQTDLGEIYFEGRGVPKDLYQGMVWTVKAAEKGAPVALIHIGREYVNGDALPKDDAKAILYVTAGIQRLPPFRRNAFRQISNRVGNLLPKDQVAKIQKDAEAWKPADGILKSVLADAEKKRPR